MNTYVVCPNLSCRYFKIKIVSKLYTCIHLYCFFNINCVAEWPSDYNQVCSVSRCICYREFGSRSSQINSTTSHRTLCATAHVDVVILYASSFGTAC